MCLLVVATQLVPDEPLIVGANRDEVLDRPATPITVLDDGPPRVLGGRDELSGGTWLAVNEHGVCAGLTNQPLGDAKDPSKRSRGELPLALARHETAAAAVDDLLGAYRPEDYNGSWLLVGDRTSLYFVDFTGLADPAGVALPPGIHVLENRALGEPSRKVDLVRQALGHAGRAATTSSPRSAASWSTTGFPRVTTVPTRRTASTSTRSAPGRRASSACPAVPVAPRALGGGRTSVLARPTWRRAHLWSRPGPAQATQSRTSGL